MTEQEEKAKFAELLLKPNSEPFKVALELFPENTSKALWIANNWPHDTEVVEIQAKLKLELGEFAGLYDKAELLRAIQRRMEGLQTESGRIIPPSADDFAKLAKLYAEMMAFIEKPQTGPAVQVIIPRAIEVPVYNSMEEWEADAQTQQRDLQNVSRSRH